MSNRYKDAYRGYLIDHHNPAPPIITLEHLDEKEYEAFYQNACINTLMVYCKDHWGFSYYDTKVGYKHPALQQDWVKTTSEVLKRKGIEFNAYYCIEYDVQAPKENPQWSVRHADGKPCRLTGRNAKWGMPCYLTGYRRYVLSQLEEIVEGYGPDSLFLDIFGKSLCYCPSCKQTFKTWYGYDLPESDEGVREHAPDVIRFLDDCAEAFLNEILSKVKAIDPDLAVTINFSSHYPKRIRDKLDYHFTEPWAGNWHSAAFARETGTCPQLGPGDVSFVYDYLPENVYRLAAAEIAAQGCRVFFYSEPQRPDGSLEKEEADRIGSAMKMVREYEHLLKDRRVHAEVGILQSDSSVVVGYRGVVEANAIARARSFNIHVHALKGAMKAVDYAQVPWKIVPEENLEEALGGLKVLILPEVLIVENHLLSLLEHFVQAGGMVLATGASGLYSRDGNLLEEFAISELAGIGYKGMDDRYVSNVWGGFLDLVDKDSWDMADTSFPITPVSIDFYQRDSLVEGFYTEPATVLSDSSWVNWGYPPPKLKTCRPLVSHRNHGNGDVWYVGFDLFSLEEEKMNWPKDFFSGILRKSGYQANVCLQTSAPNTIHAVSYWNEETLIIHVVSHLARLTRGDILPVKPGTLKIAKELKGVISEVTMHGRKAHLEPRDGGDHWAIEVPEITECGILEVR